MKMSVARKELLENLAGKRLAVSESYPPMKWLLSQGYAEIVHVGKFGSTTYSATEAGCKVLAEDNPARAAV